MQKTIATRFFVCVLKICQGIRRYGFGGRFLCKAMMTIAEIVVNRLDAEASLYSSLAKPQLFTVNNSMVRAFINH